MVSILVIMDLSLGLSDLLGNLYYRGLHEVSILVIMDLSLGPLYASTPMLIL